MTDMLGYIFSTAIQFCYRISGSYVLAIIIFTLFTKVVLLPLSLWSHANSLKMVSLMPEINRLKVKYYGDREQIGEEQAALYKRARYKPLLSLVPLVFQIIILSGMVTGIHSITDTGVSPMLGLIPFETEGWTLIAPLLAGLAAGDVTMQVSYSPIRGFDPSAIAVALQRYPYGCTEQLVSTAYPLLYAETF